MRTPQSQIKINLPVQLKDFIESKAQRYGLPLAQYIKHLIVKDVADLKYPEYRASQETERLAQKALKERSKSVVVGDLKQFFKNL